LGTPILAKPCEQSKQVQDNFGPSIPIPPENRCRLYRVGPSDLTILLRGFYPIRARISSDAVSIAGSSTFSAAR
jgi:hypothetical protein